MANDKVIVIGAGPAGMRAALTLVENGVLPVVIDEAEKSGGQIYRRPMSGLDRVRPSKALYGFEASKADRLHAAFDAIRPRIDYRPGSTVWTIEGDQIFVSRNDKVEKIKWDRLIVASGAMDRIIPLKGWTLPGAYSLGASQIALKAQAVGIGSRVVFFGTGPLLYLVAYQYAKAGIDVAAVLDVSPFPPLRILPQLATGGATFAKGLYYIAWLKARGVRIERGITPIEIGEGPDNAVSDFKYRTKNGVERRIDTPAVAFGYGLKSETQIADLLGLDFAFDSIQRQWLPRLDDQGRSSSERVYLAGDGARVRGADVAELAGERAAMLLLTDMGIDKFETPLTNLKQKIQSFEPFRAALEESFPFPAKLAAAVPDDVIICRCEGITARQLRMTIEETSECEINRLKAFTRVGMGRCQGRVCGPSALEFISAVGGCTIDAAGRIRGQAPIKPVPLSTISRGIK